MEVIVKISWDLKRYKSRLEQQFNDFCEHYTLSETG